MFYCFQLINVKNRRHIINYQFNLAAICLVYLYLWLVEFWCTCSLNLAPHIKSQKFSRNMVRTSFNSQKINKIKTKSCPPASFSEKVPEKHFIDFFWSHNQHFSSPPVKVPDGLKSSPSNVTVRVMTFLSKATLRADSMSGHTKADPKTCCMAA